MRVSKLNKPNQLVLAKTQDYLINWDKDGASKLEIKFRDLIKPYWKNKIVLFQFRIPGSLLRVDFICASNRLAVEISPESHHGNFNEFFHKGNRLNYINSLKRDDAKYNWLIQNNFKFLELNEKDLDLFSPKYIEEKFDVCIL